MLDIPLPPLPRLGEEAVVYGVAAGAIVLGVALLLWGRHLHRAVLMLAGAGAGFLLAEPLGRLIGAEITLARAVAMFSAAILGLVLARVVWPAIAGALCVGAATIVLKDYHGLLLWPYVATWPEWLGAIRVAAMPDASLVQNHAKEMWIVLGGTGAVVFVLGVLLGRGMAIFMTALIGAIAIGGGVALAVLHRKPELWPAAWQDVLVPAAVVGGMVLLGIVGQTRGLLAARARKAEADSEQQKGETPAARSAET
jgi:hypothetical protein